LNRDACWIAAGDITACPTGTGNGTVASGAWSRFSYAPDRSRFNQVSGSGSSVETTVYVGSLFEKEVAKTGSTETSVKYIHYIRGAGRVVAELARVVPAGGSASDTTEYWHRDHLGSIVARTDGTGTVAKRCDYDTWGMPLGCSGDKRGYTGHEHLAGLGLIHMNGRVYDPEIGRFLSPDPFVQFPESTQGYNRYAYVNNHPLSYNDPSGHWIQFAMIAFSTIRGYQQGGSAGAVNGFVLSVGSAAVASGIGAHFAKAAEANAAVLDAPFAEEIAAGLRPATDPFLSSGQFLAKAALHGVAQGAISRAGGGRFSDGFLGAVASSMSEGLLDGMPNGVGQAVAAAVIGGSISVIGGGKFANGAITAAFVNVFNKQGHDTWETLSPEEQNELVARAQAQLTVNPVENATTLTTRHVPAAPTPDGTFCPDGSCRDGRPHYGADLIAPVGTPVRSAGASRSAEAKLNVPGLGMTIYAYYPDSVEVRYAHLSEVNGIPLDGPRMRPGPGAGQTIGKAGMTGTSVSPKQVPHLHVEVLVDNIRIPPERVFNWSKK